VVLEHFLEYPFPPRTNQATNVEEALESWGREAFSVLFDSGVARDWMTEAKRATEFRLQVSADDPGILSWPWEALYDPEMGVLAHRAQVERRLNKNLPDPPPLSAELPKDRINILLVTARPYEQDIHFRSISRPLVELIQKGQLPVHVDLLRPPTFDQLRKHLAAHSHFYHLRLKKNVGPLLDRSIESLTLAIEIFNRPSEIARTHAVLILLQHSFELLLKALILKKTGRVHEPDGRFSYSFARCLTIATEELKALTPDERSTLAILDAQRDQAAHYYAEVSEDLLYIHAQSAVTLYDKFLRKSFSVSLGSRMPTRILPVSSQPPPGSALCSRSPPVRARNLKCFRG
jgi:hypothetical protein